MVSRWTEDSVLRWALPRTLGGTRNQIGLRLLVSGSMEDYAGATGFPLPEKARLIGRAETWAGTALPTSPIRVLGIVRLSPVSAMNTLILPPGFQDSSVFHLQKSNAAASAGAGNLEHRLESLLGSGGHH